MFDFYIFDLAVYRCTEEMYYAARDRSTARQLERTQSAFGITRDRFPDSYGKAEEAYRDSYGGPWEFNQVVGWIRLYVEASHVGAHLWWVDAKRLQPKMRKTFYLTSLNSIFDKGFAPAAASDEIFSNTLSNLEKLAKEKRFKGRQIDLQPFRNVGPFINWRRLLKSGSCREE